jgi:dipeptidyl aminopeptidase/acylaminoacyl peptidase
MKSLRLGPGILVLGCLVPAAAGGERVGDSASAPPPAGAARMVYASDWSGTSQLYAVDTSGRRPAAQITFDRPPACVPGTPCGFTDPVPSPDGRRVLFSEYGTQPVQLGLYASLADGRTRRRLGTPRRFAPQAVWSPDSRRIAYAAEDGIHVVNADGSGARRLRRNAFDRSPAWSADGRALAFVNAPPAPASQTLHVVRRGVATTVATSGERSELGFRWSPVGDWLAYTSSRAGLGDLYVVRPGTPGGRALATAVSAFAWSPDGKLLAFVDRAGLKVADVTRRSVRDLAAGSAHELAWSPNGKLLAYTEPGGIQLVAVATRARRELGSPGAVGLAWSPNGQSLAYGIAAGGSTNFGPSVDVRLTTLSGSTRTVVAGGGTLGGTVRGFAWMRPPLTVAFRRPASRSLATIAADRLVAPWPIERIASDGTRVAYTTCGHVFVWTPSAGEVVQREATTSLSPACSSANYFTSYRIYSLALAGDRIAYGTVFGGIGRTWWLGGMRGGGETFTLGEGRSTAGPAYSGELVGELAGSGDLLVFSTWREQPGPQPGSAVTAAQEVRRAPPVGCPCPMITSSVGPLLPFDVDARRVLAGGDNATWLVGEDGTRLLSLPVSPRGAQLSGRDLVVVRRAELRHYDAATGTLVHAWSLPDVASGRECGSPNAARCERAQSEVVLQDLAHGLVTYVLEGRLHVLRLADGADAVVASATLARFLDAGLVYVDGARLELIPFGRLALR